MKRILVTGAGGAASANFIDSLKISKEQFYIVGVDLKPFLLELAKVDQSYLVPAPTEANYIDSLNKIIEKEKIDFVHAQPDNEVITLSKYRGQLKAKVFLPDHKTLTTFADKAASHAIWKKEKVNIPEAFHPQNLAELKKFTELLLKKHPLVWVRAIHGAGSKASLPVKNFRQAKYWIEYWTEMRGLTISDFMVSEFLPLKEFAFQSIWHEGKLITSQARERIEYIFSYLSASGQTSSPSVAKTVHNKEVNETATKAVLAVDQRATGIFCVDLKENALGKPCVTEVNAGRFFTTSNFFAHAGLNMPYYYIKLAFKEDLPKLDQYDGLREGWYWVRMVDLGYKLVKEGKWKSKKI